MPPLLLRLALIAALQTVQGSASWAAPGAFHTTDTGLDMAHRLALQPARSAHST
ncbi:MAG: hypothetical protein LBG43_09765 [Treponema sp.]|nr:hypothetical protein [Treponema sp.]